jgi:hypothetical protein
MRLNNMQMNYNNIPFDNPLTGRDSSRHDYLCSEMLLNAITLYIVSNRPPEEHNSESVYRLLAANKEEYSPYNNYSSDYNGHFFDGTGLDETFNYLYTKKPNALEIEYYKIFKLYPKDKQLSVIATLMAANFKRRSKTK